MSSHDHRNNYTGRAIDLANRSHDPQVPGLDRMMHAEAAHTYATLALAAEQHTANLIAYALALPEGAPRRADLLRTAGARLGVVS